MSENSVETTGFVGGAVVIGGVQEPTNGTPSGGSAQDEGRYAFIHDGVRHTFAPTTSALTPGFVRRNRHNDSEVAFGLIELLAEPDTLRVIDDMPWNDFQALMTDFGAHLKAHMGGSMGESRR